MNRHSDANEAAYPRAHASHELRATPMRLTFWHNILWSRYKGVILTELYRIAATRGVAVEIIQIAETDSSRAALSPVDLSWHQYPFKLLFKGGYGEVSKWKLYPSIARETWRSKADLTILAGYHAPEYWLQALILKLRGRKFGIPCDSTIYDNAQTYLKGLAKHFIFSRASIILCYGSRSADYARHNGAHADRVVTNCQAAALPRDYAPDIALARRIAEAAPSSAPRYLFVGRLSPEKSIDTLIEAFALLRKREPAATLVIVGSGPAEIRLKSLAADLSLSESVAFPGAKFDEALVAEYTAATCLVLPSKSEPWGLVVNEALSYGCPVVVSDRCGCVPELVIDGRTGYAFEWGNTEQMAEKMLCGRDALGDATTSAKACIEHMRPYTPEAAAHAILEGYERIVGQAKADV
jgi:glycosyltransferase involved in cell wall biosynthesis